MITRIELARKRAGSSYDPKTKQYITYRVHVRVNGRRYRQSGFPSRKAAEAFIDGLRQKKAYIKAGLQVPVGRVRIETLFKTRLGQIPNKAEQIRAQRIFNYFVELTGNVFVNEVRPVHIQKFINARGNVKPETINREINLLSAAFRRAPELFPDELDGLELPTIPRPKFKRKRRERTITIAEKDAILAALYSDRSNETEAEYQNRVRIGRMFHIAYLLGMAYSEVANLKKADYTGEQLSFIRKKTGNTVIFEWLPDEAKDVLDAAIGSSDTDYIFTHSGSTPKHFYQIMQKAIEAAGLPYGRDSGVTFHSARHSFVTAAMQHADLKTVGSMSGHTDATMVMLYTHASPESRKKALQSMYGKKDWRTVYDKIRKGKMSFDEFEKLLS
jgi:integrase